MRYLKLAPFFVYLALNNAALVSAAPLDQATALGDLTIGLVGPTAVPNAKLPAAGPNNALPTGAPSVPGAPRAAGAPGLPKIPGLSAVPGLAGIAKPPHLPIPGLASLPVRRSPEAGPGHSNPRLQPRMIHNADYGAAASPNGTIPQVPTPDPTAAVAKRAMKDFRQGFVLPSSTAEPASHTPKSKRATKSRARSSRRKGSSRTHRTSRPQTPARPQHTDIAKPEEKTPPSHETAPSHDTANAASSSSSSSGPAGGLADLVKSLGGASKGLAPAANSLPSSPDTPLTAADTNPTIDAADTTANVEAKPKAPVAVEEKKPVPGENAGAYPNAPGYQVAPQDASVSAKTKRHSFVLDTDPLLPPSDEAAAKKDPAMGVLNMDSNHKADPPKPKLPTAENPAITPAPTSTDATPTSSTSIYQPSEPGYAKSYPTAGSPPP